METESASNEEENNEQDKRDHIKERLKEMGVSQDSVRPHKTWFSRNINYLILSVVAVLVGAFAIEYQSSKKMQADSSYIAKQSTVNNQAGNQSGYPYYYNQPGNNAMAMEMQSPSWPPPQYAEHNTSRDDSQSENRQDTQANVENNTYQNQNSGWYAQHRFYGQPPNYGQTYQQPPVQNQRNTEPQKNIQNQEQRGWSDNHQQTYRGQNDGQYNGNYYGQYTGNNNWPAYNPYYVPMPNPYSMSYPTAGYYNGWYR